MCEGDGQEGKNVRELRKGGRGEGRRGGRNVGAEEGGREL